MIDAISATILVVAIGYLLRRRQFLPAQAWQAMSRLCYWVLFPGLIFRLISTARLDASFVAPLFLAILAGSLCVMIYALVAVYGARLPNPQKGALFQGAIRNNTFLALSVVQAAFGQTALAAGAIAIAVMVPLYNFASVLALLVWRGSGSGAEMRRAVGGELMRNPLLLAVVAGAAVNLSGVPVPRFVLEASGFLGAGALPLLLLCIGASLEFRAFASHALPLCLAVFAKIAVFPLALVLVAHWLGLEREVIAVLAVIGAAPTATSSFALASELGADTGLMAEIISLQTIVSAASMPMWVFIALSLPG